MKKSATKVSNRATQQHVVDNTDKLLTTNDGVAITDNNNTLKVGARGPSLQQDHIYLDKLMHFDRERIPERVVHARGSAAHGVFEATTDIFRYTTADFLTKGKITPVFVRFSTVAGSKGSTDLARDVRGFSVKFYTQEGNYDLVGNNIPVFFIQDAMNFPDLVHAVKPEPDNEMPQAASAHDTFWDFVSLMPESAHMVMWTMSDRAIPRSLRTMEGFGVHTFKFINDQGKATFVKFHWKPRLGVHSVSWNEAQKISGFNSDFHREDLWEAIDKGNYPQWDLGVQLIPEKDEFKYSFDLLDPTKIVPEELVPVTRIGTMTLNRNPENFFAETEQSAFDPGRLVPGIDVTNDPLLQGRIFSYMDTQNYRLGGANFHELPINKSINGKYNNQKDGTAQQHILKGNVSYFPNSLANGCPYHAMLKGEQGFMSHEETVAEPLKVRRRTTSFADHFTQAKLFFHSQSPEEQVHIVNAYSFELSKVKREEIKKRELAILNQIDSSLAKKVGDNLGLTPPKTLDPLTIQFASQNHPGYPLKVRKPEVEKSKALSMRVAPGSGTIATRKIACMIATGVDEAAIESLNKEIKKEGAVLVLIADKAGPIKTSQGNTIASDGTLATEVSVCYDAVFTPSGKSITTLFTNVTYIHFVEEAYKHCKVVAFGKRAEDLLSQTRIKRDEAVLLEEDKKFSNTFVEKLKQHRVWHLEQQRNIPI